MNLERARTNMVEQQIRPWEVLDQDVLDLLYVVPREEFVPEQHRALAFSDLEIPIGDRTFRLSGTVVHCGGEPVDGFRVGVAFRAPSMRFRAKLAEQLLRIEELERTLRVSREEAARRWAEEYAAEFAELYEK